MCSQLSYFEGLDNGISLCFRYHGCLCLRRPSRGIGGICAAAAAAAATAAAESCTTYPCTRSRSRKICPPPTLAQQRPRLMLDSTLKYLSLSLSLCMCLCLCHVPLLLGPDCPWSYLHLPLHASKKLNIYYFSQPKQRICPHQSGRGRAGCSHNNSVDEAVVSISTASTK